MPDQAAIMMAIELIESGNPDDEAVGLMALGRIIADDDDEDVDQRKSAAIDLTGDGVGKEGMKHGSRACCEKT